MKQSASEVESILRERAEKLAARATGLSPRRIWERVVLIEIGRDQFGVAATDLRTVVPATTITPLPGLPSFMLGITSIRGELMSVIDPAELRGNGRTGHSELFAVIESEGRAVAIGVERVLGFRDIFEDELQPRLLGRDAEQGFTKAVTKDLVSVLDVARLYSHGRLLVDHQRSTGALRDGEEA